MTGHGEILADNQDKSKKDESKKTPLDLYIGIFFDGTNNNKYQTMLGKMFRRKEIFKKAIQRQCPDQKYLQCTNGEPIIVSSVEQLLKKYSRAEVEEIFRGAFTRSDRKSVV